jgi:hypothetical protein
VLVEPALAVGVDLAETVLGLVGPDLPDDLDAAVDRLDDLTVDLGDLLAQPVEVGSGSCGLTDTSP